MEKFFYDSFLVLLEENKKEAAVTFAISLLEEKKFKVSELYLQVLIPAMKHVRIERENNKISAWKERLIEGILKTIIEATYVHILKEKEALNGKKVLIASPVGEYEQVGAMVANNIFTLLGFEVFYVGANLEDDEILSAVEHFKPDYYTIGLKNFYNAFETKRLLDSILVKFPSTKIVVGGPVFKNNEVQHKLPHHYFVHDYHELFDLAKEIKNETSI